jgi:hypothetical protein
MKKFIYVILIAFSSSLIISSCTEEEVAPTMDNTGTGGTGSSGGSL